MVGSERETGSPLWHLHSQGWLPHFPHCWPRPKVVWVRGLHFLGKAILLCSSRRRASQIFPRRCDLVALNLPDERAASGAAAGGPVTLAASFLFSIFQERLVDSL